MVQRLQVERHQIERLRSVAHLFPASRGRQGVYALAFGNGERYVGQSTNVVGRLATHRRRWPDIVSVEFSRVPKAGDLDEVEQRWIRAEAGREQGLRNIKHALGPINADCDLDFDVTSADQGAWLNDDVWLADEGARTDHKGQRAKTQMRYENLKASPLFDDIIRGLRSYVNACLPRPRATELTFWALSAAPSTNRSTWPRLAAISINSMETLVLGHFHHEPARPWGFINVSKAKAQPATKRLFRRRHPGLDVISTSYEAAGPDVVRVQFDSVDQLTSLLDDPESPIREAARSLNLRLMRKGPTMQWRAHSPALADHLL